MLPRILLLRHHGQWGSMVPIGPALVLSRPRFRGEKNAVALLFYVGCYRFASNIRLSILGAAWTGHEEFRRSNSDPAWSASADCVWLDEVRRNAGCSKRVRPV